MKILGIALIGVPVVLVLAALAAPSLVPLIGPWGADAVAIVCASLIVLCLVKARR